MLKLIKETSTQKIYEGYGYKIIIRKLFPEDPLISISIKGLGINQYLIPELIPQEHNLVMSFKNINNMTVEDFIKNNWEKNITNFKNEYSNRYTELITFK